MLSSLAKLSAAVGLLLALWGLSRVSLMPDSSWVQPEGTHGRVRILQFYASVGALTQGEKALLCYGVENARSVRISPWMARVYPSAKHCMEVGPQHTTHYTILAEGYDGTVAMKSLTLPVNAAPIEEPKALQIAALRIP